MTAEAKAGAADAMAVELLGEKAAEKEAAVKKAKGKNKKAKAAPFTAATRPVAAATSAGAPKPAEAPEGLPEAVWRAAAKGGAQAVAAWLDEGGGLDAGCAERLGTTLLMEAAVGGQEAMVRMLLQRGASVNLQTSLGGTALMHAAIPGHTTVVQVLLDAKADASLQTKTGYTALKIAEHQEHIVAAQLLRQHAERQTATAEAAEIHAAPTAPNLSGHRVRIFDLKGRPELNGRCGVAGRFDAAKGRYEVAVEGEAEAVLLKPANLQETLEPYSKTVVYPPYS